MVRDILVNRTFDRIARTEIVLFGKAWPAFQVSVISGMLASIVLAMVLVTHLGLSLAVTAAIFLTGAMGFFGLTLATKMATSREVYVCHRNGLVAIAAVLMTLWLLDKSVLPYLDVTVLSLGTCHALWRVGCLMVGCCHGRPCRWGICYDESHAAAGFAPSMWESGSFRCRPPNCYRWP